MSPTSSVAFRKDDCHTLKFSGVSSKLKSPVVFNSLRARNLVKSVIGVSLGSWEEGLRLMDLPGPFVCLQADLLHVSYCTLREEGFMQVSLVRTLAVSLEGDFRHTEGSYLEVVELGPLADFDVAHTLGFFVRLVVVGLGSLH